MHQETSDMPLGSVSSPLSANDSGEEVAQTDPPPANGSESPLFCPDGDAGRTEIRALFRGLEDSPAPQQDKAAGGGFDALPEIVHRYTAPDPNSEEENNPLVSAQASLDPGDAASPDDSELSDLRSEISSSEGAMDDFVVPDESVSESEDSGPESDPEDGAAASVSRKRIGKSSGLVTKEKIGKTVKGARKNSRASTKKTSPSKPSKKKPGSRMLDELASHIEDVVKPTRDNMAGPLFNYDTVKLTRKQKRELDLAKQDRCLSPRGTYNLNLLMEEQHRKVRGRKVFYNTEEETIRRSPRFTAAAQTSTSRTTTKAEAQPQQTSDPKASKISSLEPKPSDIIIQTQAIMAQQAWIEWTKRKTEITDLVGKNYYSFVERDHYPEATSILDIPAYLPDGKHPPGFDPIMEKGLHVFQPTAELFNNFSYFLRVVEQIAGRREGVVKVIVPPECLHQQIKSNHNPSNETESTPLKTCSVYLKDRKGEEDHFDVYDVATTDTEGLTAAAWRQTIDDERSGLQKSPKGAKFHDGWKEIKRGEEYFENSMVSDNKEFSSKAFCATDVPATAELRDELRCCDPKLRSYKQNHLLKSGSVKDGVNAPVFHTSHEVCTMFGMRMANLGAYSLNYLHDGAPKIWTVVRPMDHQKLEELLHGYLQHSRTSLIVVPRPRLPPTCDNFLEHNPLYVPRQTLKMYDIPYTEVNQHVGEMVIIFPFAYHEAWNEGPNIAESMGYASDRWMMFPRLKLLKHCNKECSAGGKTPDFDLEFVFRPPSEEGEIGFEHIDSDESGGNSTPTISQPRNNKRKKTENISQDTDSEDSQAKDVKRTIRETSEGGTSWGTYSY